MLRILEHEFVGVRAEQSHTTLKQYRAFEDQPVLRGVLGDHLLIVLQERHGMPE